VKRLAIICILLSPLIRAAELTDPPMPDTSPIAEFREWLKATPTQRTEALAARHPQNRKILEEKISQYLSLSEEERERRLDASELRWYLRTLMEQPVDVRAARLEKAPEHLRKTIQERLKLWDAVPLNAQKKILENELTIEQKTIQDYLQEFFKLPEQKQEKALNSFQPRERSEISKTLTVFRQLPPGERSKTTAAFSKFATMGRDERLVFLNKVNRWKAMSPEAKDEWRQVVKEVPAMPPLPPGMEPQPPMPPIE
jgi:hypothetical protein